jgi:hypothetical protein
MATRAVHARVALEKETPRRGTPCRQGATALPRDAVKREGLCARPLGHEIYPVAFLEAADVGFGGGDDGDGARARRAGAVQARAREGVLLGEGHGSHGVGGECDGACGYGHHDGDASFLMSSSPNIRSW